MIDELVQLVTGFALIAVLMGSGWLMGYRLGRER